MQALSDGNSNPPWLNQLGNGEEQWQEFIASGYTITEVYQMAGWLENEIAILELTGKPICLATENKAMIAAAILASLASGSILLLPFALSKNALAELRENSDYTYAISEVKRDFPINTKVICPTPDHPPIDLINIKPDNEFLRLFTGGSTGAPKCWSKTANNLFSEAFYLANKYAINQNDLIIATVSPYHIYGLLFTILIPLLTGATVIDQTPSFPGEIIETIKNNNATILASVPVHYRVLRGRKINSNSLRIAFSSAGMLNKIDADDFFQQNLIPLIEVYGSTETGGVATRIRSNNEEAFTPFDTVDWQINQENLLVNSVYIAPNTNRDKNGFFITGDRVEKASENSFNLQGRSDAVTKVGGKRVDLAEIADKIKKMANVEDCLVMATPAPSGRESIIVALVQGAEVDIKNLKKNLANRLEPYALPRLMKKLTIPLTKAGKYDMAAINKLLAE